MAADRLCGLSKQYILSLAVVPFLVISQLYVVVLPLVCVKNTAPGIHINFRFSRSIWICYCKSNLKLHHNIETVLLWNFIVNRNFMDE